MVWDVARALGQLVSKTAAVVLGAVIVLLFVALTLLAAWPDPSVVELAGKCVGAVCGPLWSALDDEGGHERGLRVERRQALPAGVTLAPMQMAADSGTARCRICGDGLHLSEAVFCQSCLAPHHRDCIEYNGICSTYGCGCRLHLPRRRSVC